MPKKVLIQCAAAVNRNAISRATVDGVELVTVKSKTLPSNVVMNSVLYPAAEVATSFHTLERTLCPVEHPTNADGLFISAGDPEAIHNFYAGAYSTNVRLGGDGFVHLDAVVNVQQAQMTDRGKRLLDRIEELETNDKARPIHTSVGVWIELEDTDGPQTEFNGLATNAEFTGIARGLVFDHNALLLDSIGAATPEQGVGMAVNAAGDEYTVERFVAAAELPDVADGEMSHDEIFRALMDAIQTPPLNGDWVVRVFASTFIFEVREELFSVPYTITNGIATLTGIPLPVVRDETFTPRVNQKGDDMKDIILAALAAASIATEGLDDDALLLAYNKLQEPAPAAPASDPTVAEQIASALAPVFSAIEAIQANATAATDTELDALATKVADSGLYPNLDAESAKLLGIPKLKEMSANCLPSFGVNGHLATASGDENKSAEMPD